MMFANFRNKIFNTLTKPAHIAPLAVFRILFGGIMFISIIRFWLKGWVNELYIQPKFFFSYYGFEWVKPMGEPGMYILFAIMALAALMIMTGTFYRIAAVIFFISFTYVELIDKANYLNHYYFISIVSFLLILLPAHRYFSIDVLRKPQLRSTFVPFWTIGTIKLQLVLVYFFAGLAKVNYDWLIGAMPLKLWLPAHTNLPFIGQFMGEVWVAYLFSWFGAIYDLSIPFFLLMRKTRLAAYLFVVVFHVMTAMLFPIGMFPYIMILSTLIFFSEGFHKNLINAFSSLFGNKSAHASTSKNFFRPAAQNLILGLLGIYFLLQVIIPFRAHFYPGKLFWTEQGYRFSWRVMLMEKAGTAFFYIKDPETGRQGEVMVCDYLTPNQEKMMSTQPDMILQFAHFIKDEYQKDGISNPEVKVESYVTLNGSGSRPFIDPDIDLTKIKDGFRNKTWILPFEQNPLITEM